MRVDIQLIKGSGYYLRIMTSTRRISRSYVISKLIGMTMDGYRDLMIKDFNANSNAIGSIRFWFREDAEKAREWLEPKLLAVKLRGEL